MAKRQDAEYDLHRAHDIGNIACLGLFTAQRGNLPYESYVSCVSSMKDGIKFNAVFKILDWLRARLKCISLAGSHSWCSVSKETGDAESLKYCHGRISHVSSQGKCMPKGITSGLSPLRILLRPDLCKAWVIGTACMHVLVPCVHTCIYMYGLHVLTSFTWCP